MHVLSRRSIFFTGIEAEMLCCSGCCFSPGQQAAGAEAIFNPFTATTKFAVAFGRAVDTVAFVYSSQWAEWRRAGCCSQPALSCDWEKIFSYILPSKKEGTFLGVWGDGMQGDTACYFALLSLVWFHHLHLYLNFCTNFHSTSIAEPQSQIHPSCMQGWIWPFHSYKLF